MMVTSKTFTSIKFMIFSKELIRQISQNRSEDSIPPVIVADNASIHKNTDINNFIKKMNI